MDDLTINWLPFLKLNLGPVVKYGHVAHLGLLHLLTLGFSLLILEKHALVRMDFKDGLCRLLLIIFDDSNIFFMSESSSKIGRLFLITLNTSGFLGLCVETYGMTF